MLKYKNEWKPYNLNKNFWKEVFEGRKIKKVNFSKDGIKYLLLDSGEKIFVDRWKEKTPIYIKEKD